MKKLGLLVKEISQKTIKDNLKTADSVFIINYSNVAGPDLSTLRQSLRHTNTTLFVVKNSVAKRALKDSELDQLLKSVEGPCGLVFIKDDPVGASRILYDFKRSHEGLKLQGGYLKDRIIDRSDIEELSRLPAKEVLRARLVSTLNSPISGLVMVLNQTLRKFVWCLEQIKQKKSTVDSPQSTVKNSF